MSGRVDNATGKVQLSPSIWIRCRSKRCKDEFRRAVDDLSYLREFRGHFRLDAPRFACQLTRCPSSVVRRADEAQTAPKSNAGAIAGGVVGGVVLVVLLAMAYFVYWRRKMQIQRPSQEGRLGDTKPRPGVVHERCATPAGGKIKYRYVLNSTLRRHFIRNHKIEKRDARPGGMPGRAEITKS
jgi:hypothetical protein